MAPPPTDELAAAALEAATAAGDLLLDRFRRPPTGVARKSSATDMVSDADRDAEALIRSILARRRPGDAVLGEEGGRAGDGELLWVVDPLDGTTNYLYRQPVWSVSIACEDADGALVGVVHQPALGETFTAVRGAGARLNGTPIATSDCAELGRALVATGFAYAAAVRAGQAAALAEVLPVVRDVRRGGSAALDLAWVACGRVDGYYELGTHRWDRAAGELLVREAGGAVSPLEPVRESGEGVVASGRALHAALSGLLAGALLH